MAKRYWINYLKEYIFTPTAPANDTTSQTGTFKAMVERIQNRMTQEKGVPWYEDAPTTNSATATHIAQGSSAHGGVLEKLQKDGVDAAKQRTVNFTGPGVTVSDDGVNARTNVDIPGGGGGGGGGSAHIIQEEGATLSARSRLNFRGVGATATDDSGNDRTNVDVRGNVHYSSTAPTSPVTGEKWLDSSITPAAERHYNGSAFVIGQAVPTDSSVTDVKVAASAGIAKSKLGALAIDTADLATNRTLFVTCTSSTRPTNPPTGQAIYETDTANVFVNTGTPSVPLWISITASETYQATDFISGLQLTWDAANTLGIETGAAYIPGNSDVMEVTTRLTRAVTFPASSTAWHHVYLWSNGGSPDVDISTTAPATPYMGKARYKTGANTHRYLGSILPNGVATPVMYNWHWHPNNLFQWVANTQAAPFVRIAGNNPTAEATVSCSPVVPPTSRSVYADLDMSGDTGNLLFGHSQDNLNLGGNEALLRIWNNDTEQQMVATLPLDTSQAFTYRFTSAAQGGLYMSVLGYMVER